MYGVKHTGTTRRRSRANHAASRRDRVADICALLLGGVWLLVAAGSVVVAYRDGLLSLPVPKPPPTPPPSPQFNILGGFYHNLW